VVAINAPPSPAPARYQASEADGVVERCRGLGELQKQDLLNCRRSLERRPTREAPRLCRGASNIWGVWGALSRPPISSSPAPFGLIITRDDRGLPPHRGVGAAPRARATVWAAGRRPHRAGNPPLHRAARGRAVRRGGHPGP